jgi:thiamine-monophosphate kinase
MDVSDGLALDASRLAGASNVTIDFSRDALTALTRPLRAALGRAEKTDEALFDYVLYSGESHAILATFAPESVPDAFTAIGRVIEPVDGAAVALSGEAIDPRGWHPFSY